MATSDMVMLKFIQLFTIVIVMVVGMQSYPAESTVVVQFHHGPPAQTRSSTAVFLYSIKKLDGSNACEKNGCSIACQLDGKLLPCLANSTVLENLTVNQGHKFLINVTTHNGEGNSSAYSWYIDTIHPTATISSEQNYTNASNIAIDVTFSEPCTGNGGFNCLNSSNCDVTVTGPGHVHASSLHIIEPGTKYTLDVILSSKCIQGRLVIRMADNICADRAGNWFLRTNGSTMIIHLDRRPVLLDFWTSVPSYELVIRGVPRTVLATNKLEDLIFFLDFSIPIINSTEQILNALHVNSGILMPIHGRDNMNRRFVFQLKNIMETKIITVDLEAGSIIGRTGAPVSPVAPITFLYDLMKPNAVLSTSSPSLTRESNINIIVEFTKPVFGFEASMVEVMGGRIVRFKELSRALYLLTVLTEIQDVVSVTIPAGKVTDISGNENMASNQLALKHYSTPAISVALHSFVTAGTIATSLAAAIISISSANLGAIGVLASRLTNLATTDPSMNLHGMVGHLQVFVLSDWYSVNKPTEYSETIGGLRWLIPRQKLPWKTDSVPILPNPVLVTEGKLAEQSHDFSIGAPSDGRASQIDSNLTSSSYIEHELPLPLEIAPKSVSLQGQKNISKINTFYGLPLSSNEYFSYFLRGEPMSAIDVVKRMEYHKGWQDLEMNLFWLAVGGGSLLLLHVLTLLFLRWRTGTPVHGILSIPRFELFLLILMLPCISQSAAFVIRGGTTGGIIVGALLLAIPAAFIFSVSLFLIIAIFFGSSAQYKEVKHVHNEETCYACKELRHFFTGRPTIGKWFYREGLPSSFFSRFGVLFENRKGPPLLVLVDQNDPSTIPKWTNSSENGIGRMRPVNSEDSNEEIIIPMSRRVLGCVRSSYIILDLLRRVSLGIISGAYSSAGSSKSIFALIITLIQFIYLFTIKPYIRRGVQVVESVSLLCEVAIFGLSISGDSSNLVKAKTSGSLMLALLFFAFIAQIINEWYALINFLLRLSPPQKKSFKLGLKLAAKGLILPFLPRKYWSRVIPAYSQPKTGLASIIPLSPDTELERRQRASYIDPISATTATVVPMLSPGSPCRDVIGPTSPTTAERTSNVQRTEEGKRLKTIKAETKNELKMLQELAKASFSWDRKGYEASTSYAFRAKPSSGDCEASSETPRVLQSMTQRLM
ncbi:Transmembrane protein [Quillaja saponaria]|uniref:Transmembrane protein n=1 Tax=Quillaja saponaria TaxID=32244 RepID=A0AAD7PX53_QUISA|nr:Transmembrane protein [Quillaja saponaria]